MRIERPRDSNRVFKAPANWDEKALGPCSDLPVRIDLYPDGPLTPQTIVRVTSAWRPTPAELAILNHGGVVEVTVCGNQPPLVVHVEPDHEPADEQPHDARLAPTGLTINEDGHGFGHDEHGPATP